MDRRYNEFANSFIASYSEFLFALQGAYLSRVAPGAEITPQLISDFMRDVDAVTATYVTNAMRSLWDFHFEVWDGSSVADDMQRVTLARLAIVGIIADNAYQLERRLKGSKKGFLNLLHNTHGGVGLLVQRKMQKMDFTATDTSGRTWDAKKLMYVIVRDFAYQTVIDRQYADLKQAGETTGTLVYEDESHANFGLKIKLSDEEERKRFFHINATAELESVHSE